MRPLRAAASTSCFASNSGTMVRSTRISGSSKPCANSSSHSIASCSTLELDQMRMLYRSCTITCVTILRPVVSAVRSRSTYRKARHSHPMQYKWLSSSSTSLAILPTKRVSRSLASPLYCLVRIACSDGKLSKDLLWICSSRTSPARSHQHAPRLTSTSLKTESCVSKSTSRRKLATLCNTYQMQRRSLMVRQA